MAGKSACSNQLPQKLQPPPPRVHQARESALANMKQLALALVFLVNTTLTLTLAAKKNLIIDTDLFSDVELVRADLGRGPC